jgi:succinate dehydrogenase / fumarate reductase cytochrome b subunit
VAKAIGRESFLLDKHQSLTGILPVGFYMLQHLVLNSFSLAGPETYNSVSAFFYSIPEHLLWAIEVLVVWIPLAFHMVYGMFIVSRAENNYLSTRYKWSQNRMFWMQRASGLFLVVFLIFHFSTTTLQAKLHGNTEMVSYAGMRAQFVGFGYMLFVFYLLGVLAASYHLCYGIWSFCIRWGITESEEAQARVQRFSFGLFLAVTVLGWAALFGFLRAPHIPFMQA